MSSESRHRLVCRCLGVASPRIFAAARSERLGDVAAVTRSLRAGAGCTLCHREIEEILAEVRGDAVDPELARENERVCRAETRARIERWLASRIAPRLIARGARLVAARVEGLRVQVRIAGAADPELPAQLADALRGAVCEDLEVQVEIAR